jgi:hypothetical protein
MRAPLLREPGTLDHDPLVGQGLAHMTGLSPKGASVRVLRLSPYLTIAR